MSEKKKVGLDIARSSTLVQEYQVASWERNELPTTPELTAIDEKIAKDPENAELHKERGLLLAGLGRFFGGDRAVYVWVTGLTLVAAFYDLLRTLPDHLRAVLHVNGLVDTVGKALPFATIGLGWICPAILGLVIGLIFRAVRPKKA